VDGTGEAFVYDGASVLLDYADAGGRCDPVVGCVGDNTGSRDTTDLSPRQLQKKFKLAQDFGVNGNYNPTNAQRFEAAMRAHMRESGTKIVHGTYRSNPVVHHVNPRTGLNVIIDRGGNFVSGWRLSPDQLTNVLVRGKR
jgi:hypothetical protein